MKAGSGLASAPLAAPALAADAVRRAIAAAGGERPSRVFLFLSAHFARQAPRAIQAAAGAAGGLQVSGMLAEGVFTEAGWRLDQPAVAALVLGQAGAGPRLGVDGRARQAAGDRIAAHHAAGEVAEAEGDQLAVGGRSLVVLRDREARRDRLPA